MPCTPDSNCPSNDTYNYGSPNLTPNLSGAYANMGWVGFVNLFIQSLSSNNILRVTSCDINLKQEITKPDVIDGRIGKTTYQVGPAIVEGSIGMPIVADLPSSSVGTGCPTVQSLTTAGSLLSNLWCWTTARGSHGRLVHNDAKLNIRYVNHKAFTFDSAIVNTFGMTVAQGEAVTLDLNIIGRGRSNPNGNPDPTTNLLIPNYLSPARVLTWNDVTVNGVGGCSNNGDLFFSNQVRNFSMEVNNNANRFYTLNGSLFPMDVNVGKREITGSLTLMGYQDRLRLLAESNASRFTEKNEIRLAFYIGQDQFVNGAFISRDWTGASPPSTSIFFKRLSAVVFQIEEASMTNDLFETTINWHAMASDQTNYEEFDPGTSCGFPAWA